MGHQIDHCDVVDMLEESATTGRPVRVELEGGRQFTDRVKDVTTAAGQDRVTFREHGEMAVDDIRDIARAEPIEPSYAGKPVRIHHGGEGGGS